MTDRELLELAAKSIGYRAHFNLVDACQLWTGDKNDGFIRFWNPLTDDGDALRLAVKMELDVWFEGVGHVKSVGLLGEVQEVKFNKDPYEATRRAIVRAAAEIGKALP